MILSITCNLGVNITMSKFVSALQTQIRDVHSLAKQAIKAAQK
jgi:hypothetical protein